MPGDRACAASRRSWRCRRADAVFPARVVVLYAGVPLLHVEGRIGHDEVGAQVGVLVVGKGVGGLLAEVEVNAADGHVHGGQPPGGGVGFLAVDGEVAELPPCSSMKCSHCTKKPPEPQAGS